MEKWLCVAALVLLGASVDAELEDDAWTQAPTVFSNRTEASAVTQGPGTEQTTVPSRSPSSSSTSAPDKQLDSRESSQEETSQPGPGLSKEQDQKPKLGKKEKINQLNMSQVEQLTS